jgi:hypothetical protein
VNASIQMKAADCAVASGASGDCFGEPGRSASGGVA